MAIFWPKSKAIALGFCLKMTQNQFRSFHSRNWEMNMAIFWPKSGYSLGILSKNGDHFIREIVGD